MKFWFEKLPNIFVARDASLVLRAVLECLNTSPAESVYTVTDLCEEIISLIFGKGLGIQLHEKYDLILID